MIEPQVAAASRLRHRATLTGMVRQHADEAASLYEARTVLTHAASTTRDQLDDCDQRLAEQLDGLVVGGHAVASIVQELLEAESAGAFFIAGLRAIDEQQHERIEDAIALAREGPFGLAPIVAAFGWAERHALKGLVSPLLDAADRRSRLAGVAACAVQRVDPGLESRGLLHDDAPLVRARALRTIGELGRGDLSSRCASAATDEDPTCRFWASWSAVLLGHRGAALESLLEAASETGPFSARAERLALLAASLDTARRLLQSLSRLESRQRIVQSAGMTGDPSYLTWLVDQMENADTARDAGASFSLITGADVGETDLEGQPPGDSAVATIDGFDEELVTVDPDEGLPWPNPPAVRAWWAKHAHRFQPGTRYFVGAPVTREHCVEVLRSGAQRQRVLAALHLCLLEPGTELFNTSAPAWRQQRRLINLT